LGISIFQASAGNRVPGWLIRQTSIASAHYRISGIRIMAAIECSSDTATSRTLFATYFDPGHGSNNGRISAGTQAWGVGRLTVYSRIKVSCESRVHVTFQHSHCLVCMCGYEPSGTNIAQSKIRADVRDLVTVHPTQTNRYSGHVVHRFCANVRAEARSNA